MKCTGTCNLVYVLELRSAKNVVHNPLFADYVNMTYHLYIEFLKKEFNHANVYIFRNFNTFLQCHVFTNLLINNRYRI